MNRDRARVLIVDDNELNRKLLTRALQDQGHSSDIAENGKRALERLRAAGANFDLVLLDILMPEMDGYATLAEIQNDSALRHIPVIMISALDEMDSVIRCIELGATDYLPKPFNATLLRARVQASLEKKRLRDQEQELLHALERELEIGREIQASFLPQELPRVPGWEIAARFQPARQVAGDFYDAFLLAENTRLGIVIADVCDKGVGAALFMALFRSLVRAFAELFYSQFPGDTALEKTLTFTNDYIARTHERASMFATVFFAVLDPKSGALDYINAGHNPPFLLSQGVIKAQFTRTGAAVGMLKGAAFHVGKANLEVGEILFAYTDGVPDAPNANGEVFSGERLLTLAARQTSSASRLLDDISAELREHMAGAEPFDDVTLIALKRERGH